MKAGSAQKQRTDSRTELHKQMGSSMSSVRSQTTTEIKAAAEAELVEMSSQKSSSRKSSNPRVLKPIQSGSMKTSSAILTKNREHKKMYQELSKEISSLSKDEAFIKNGDVMKELNDAFSGTAPKLTQAEKNLRKGK